MDSLLPSVTFVLPSCCSADKRSLAQNDFAMARQDMVNGRLYRSLLDRLLSASGKR